MKTRKSFLVLAVLAIALAFSVVTACSSESAAGPPGPAGPQGAQGVAGPAGPSYIVAMGQVNADGSMGQSYNVNSCVWDATGQRYVINVTGITYTHNAYITQITAGDSNFTATYGADNGNLVVFFRNTAAVRQRDHFSFVVLKAP